MEVAGGVPRRSGRTPASSCASRSRRASRLAPNQDLARAPARAHQEQGDQVRRRRRDRGPDHKAPGARATERSPPIKTQRNGESFFFTLAPLRCVNVFVFRLGHRRRQPRLRRLLRLRDRGAR